MRALRGAWAFAAAFVAFGTLQTVANAILLGTQHFRSAALIGAVTGGAMVPLIIGVLAAGGGITGMFAVEAAWRRPTCSGPGCSPDACCTGRPIAVPELRRGALRFAGWTTLSALVTLVVWRRSEFLFLAHYSTDAQIGLYSIAFATVTAVSAIPEQLSTVFVSAFATLRGADAADRVQLRLRPRAAADRARVAPDHRRRRRGRARVAARSSTGTTTATRVRPCSSWSA